MAASYPCLGVRGRQADANLPGAFALNLTKLDFAQPVIPGTAVALTLYGVTLQDWLALGGLVLLGLQGAYLLWKWRREWKAKQVAGDG